MFAACLAGEANAGYNKKTSGKPEEAASLPGMVLASTPDSWHLDAMRVKFKGLGRNCCTTSAVSPQNTK